MLRVFLNVENSALYTVYCHLENIESLPMEIRIVDKNNNSTVFASSRVCGKTALIPIVFLDPNNNHSRKLHIIKIICPPCQGNKIKIFFFLETSENVLIKVFVIEVFLFKNIDIYNTTIKMQDKPMSNYDCTISCTYDKKVNTFIIINFSRIINCNVV